MVKTGTELRNILKEYCSNYLVVDSIYTLSNKNEILKLIKNSFIDKYKYKAELFDCDDYSLILHAWFRQEQYKRKWDHPLAFGEVIGKIKGTEGYHALNFMITEDEKLLLIEPQTDEVRYYDEENDHFIFIRM